jgi:cytidylate kinase
MIIVINGYPGVGKLTVGRELASLLHGQLLDIHTVYNVAFALTEFKSPEFHRAVEDVEAIAHNLILKLPAEVPVILTTVLAGRSEWIDAEWSRLVALGHARPPFLVVHLWCDVKENMRRIQSAQRLAKRKPIDPGMARRNQDEGKPLAGMDERFLLTLDVTTMTARDAALVIAGWCRSPGHPMEDLGRADM